MPVGTISPIRIDPRPGQTKEDGVHSQSVPQNAGKDARDSRLDGVETAAGEATKPSPTPDGVSTDSDKGIIARLADTFFRRRRRQAPAAIDEAEVIRAKWNALFPGSAGSLDKALLERISRVDQDTRRIHTIDGAHVDDLGTRVDVEKVTADAISVMLAVVQRHGWDEVRLDGTDEFKRAAWIALSAAGITCKGYEQTIEDVRAAARTRDASRSAPSELRQTLDLPATRASEPAPAGSAHPGKAKEPVLAAPPAAGPATARTLSYRTVPAGPLLPEAPSPGGTCGSSDPRTVPQAAAGGQASGASEENEGVDVEALRLDVPPPSQQDADQPAAAKSPGLG